MVKLQCSKCKHIWTESKQQRASEKVFCPKCGDFHHAHSRPINPPVLKTHRDNNPAIKPYRRVLNPPKETTLLQKGLDGKTMRTMKGYKTEEKKKR